MRVIIVALCVLMTFLPAGAQQVVLSRNDGMSLPSPEIFDPVRYLGKWYEVARLPAEFQPGNTLATAEYSAGEDGGLIIKNSAYSSDGKLLSSIEGKAQLAPGDPSGRLRVSFGPALPAEPNYYVLHVDDKYRFAVVGTPNRKSLHILAREVPVPQERTDELIAIADGAGFDTSKLMVADWKPQTVMEVSQAPPGVEAAVSETPLATLDWLVGNWVGESEKGSIEFSCRFTKNNAFMIRSFRVAKDSGESMSGMEVIAWDPAQQTIRSWTYDSDGGFGEAIWSQADDRYTMRAKYTLADGGVGSALHAMRYVDDNTFAWKSTNREIDGELQPDTDEVVVKRIAESEAETTLPNTDGGTN